MVDKLDTLEHALRVSIGASGQAAHETTIDRRLADRRINIDRKWEGQLRWIYATAIDDPGLSNAYGEYGLFLGWYSDPPGVTFWEGRRRGDLAFAKELVTLWVLQGAPPETLPTSAYCARVNLR